MTLTARIQLIAIGSVLATSILVLAFVSYRTDQRLQQSIGASLAARVGHHAQLVQDTVDTHLTQLHAPLRNTLPRGRSASSRCGSMRRRRPRPICCRPGSSMPMGGSVSASTAPMMPCASAPPMSCRTNPGATTCCGPSPCRAGRSTSRAST